METVKGVLFFLVVYCSQLNFVFSEDDVFKDVHIRYFNGSTNSVYTDFRLNTTKNLILHPKFDRNVDIAMYIHGWNQDVNNDELSNLLVNSYLQVGGHNVLALDYTKVAAMLYPTVVGHIPKLGETVARALINLYEAGLYYSRIHCIGYSLGAHICAEIGRTLKLALRSYIMPRITGLDPALPLYYDTGVNEELNKDDAAFVDIIHTDGNMSGGFAATGHADFYPNGGTRPQPMCGNTMWQYMSVFVGDHCAHDASVRYYAKSVTAKSTMYLATNRLNPKITAEMGYRCPITTSGIFDLKTT